MNLPSQSDATHEPPEASYLVQTVTLLAITLPLGGVIAAPFALWGWGFAWTDLGLFLGMYGLTALGITVGFHRHFSHRSFAAPMWVRCLLAIFGSMAVQGSLIKWVSLHRRHHQHSDRPEDPHTPHLYSQGFLGTLRGFWYSHIGWFFEPDPPGLERYVKDLEASPTLVWMSRLFGLWVLLGLILPGILGGLMRQSWIGVWTGLIWGGLVRVFVVHHVTWSVNSACHLWGTRPFESRDRSRNNLAVGILALGEGWHNTHHAFPNSARHGLRWWQFDASYWVIRIMALFGVTWNLKIPSRQAQEGRRRKTHRPQRD